MPSFGAARSLRSGTFREEDDMASHSGGRIHTPPSSPAPMPSAAMQADERRPTVLVVEDDAGIHDMLDVLLEDEGYIVAHAEHGQAALDYLHSNPPPCCILLDLYMPVLDGWQFHSAQLRDPQLANIPVIVMSAVANALEPLAWFRAAGYLKKPFTLEELLAQLTPICRSVRTPDHQ